MSTMRSPLPGGAFPAAALAPALAPWAMLPGIQTEVSDFAMRRLTAAMRFGDQIAQGSGPGDLGAAQATYLTGMARDYGDLCMRIAGHASRHGLMPSMRHTGTPI